VVGLILALAATVSVPIVKLGAPAVEVDTEALAVTVSSPTLAVKDTPLTKGDPTFCTLPPLTEAMANSDMVP
jgi:hypothetical protein